MTDDPEFPTEATADVARLLYQSGVAHSVDGILANLEHRTDDAPSREAVREALDAMRDHDFVRTLDDAHDDAPDYEGAYYLLTESGREFVETEVDQEGVGFIS